MMKKILQLYRIKYREYTLLTDILRTNFLNSGKDEVTCYDSGKVKLKDNKTISYTFNFFCENSFEDCNIYYEIEGMYSSNKGNHITNAFFLRRLWSHNNQTFDRPPCCSPLECTRGAYSNH